MYNRYPTVELRYISRSDAKWFFELPRCHDCVLSLLDVFNYHWRANSPFLLVRYSNEYTRVRRSVNRNSVGFERIIHRQTNYRYTFTADRNLADKEETPTAVWTQSVVDPNPLPMVAHYKSTKNKINKLSSQKLRFLYIKLCMLSVHIPRSKGRSYIVHFTGIIRTKTRISVEVYKLQRTLLPTYA